MTLWKSVFAAVVFVGLAGCVEETAPAPANHSGILSQAAAQDCTAKGGSVVTGLAGQTCAMPTPDAGKSCKRASDCTGLCMADTMSCSKLTPQFGCFQIVMDDGEKIGLCVD
jgi:hypothetical protein